MAKTKYTKDQIISFVKGLDTRAKTMDDAKLDDVINRGYAELMTTSKRLFSNEDVLPLAEYYTNTELRFSADIEDDVTEIYDIYTTIEGDNSNKLTCTEIVQGVGICRNSQVAYRDNRYLGRFHVRLDAVDEVYDNVIVKYYYTPKATDEDVYMDAQIYLAFQDAVWTALNYFVKDVEGETQKRASMQRTSKSTSLEPEDIPEQTRAVFS